MAQLNRSKCDVLPLPEFIKRIWRRSLESEFLHLFRNKNDFSNVKRHSTHILFGNESCCVTWCHFLKYSQLLTAFATKEK